jgi:hypothetical protein
MHKANIIHGDQREISNFKFFENLGIFRIFGKLGIFLHMVTWRLRVK